jgi:hypothetical protein
LQHHHPGFLSEFPFWIEVSVIHTRDLPLSNVSINL